MIGKLNRTGEGRKTGLVVGFLAILMATAAGAETAPPSRVEAERLDGTRYSLADTRGSITVIAVWSPDSLASRKCIGELDRFARLFQHRGINVMAVSTTGDADRLRNFAAERKLDLPIGILADNDLGPLPEPALPMLYVFDRNGTYQATHRGLFRLRIIEEMVEPLLD